MNTPDLLQQALDALKDSIKPLKLYEAYGWTDRNEVISQAEKAICAIEAEKAQPYPAVELPVVAWKSGNEFLPFHPQASHVSPDFRDGWNACFQAAQ